MVENGFTTLRINFRGVGKSQGQFDNGVGELTDAATALDWLQIQNPTSTQYVIAGFSFGAWIGMQLIMRRPEITSFLSISPPVNKYDFTFLSPCPIPGLVVQGNQDSIVSEEEVASLVERLSKQRQSHISYQVIDTADHFFREKLHLLEEIIDDHLKNNLLNPSQPISKKHSKMQSQSDADMQKIQQKVLLD